MKKHPIREFLGWLGVSSVLIAYIGLNFGYFTTHDIVYQSLNIYGAASIGYEAFQKRDMQAVTTNAVWGLVAAAVLCSLFFNVI